MTGKQIEYWLKAKIALYPKVTLHCLRLIYEQQTINEKQQQATNTNNGVGFSKIDSKDLTVIYNKVLHKITLTQRELSMLHNKLPKYWNQYLQLVGRNVIVTQIQKELLKP